MTKYFASAFIAAMSFMTQAQDFSYDWHVTNTTFEDHESLNNKVIDDTLYVLSYFFGDSLDANPGTSVVEMDTVIGRKGGKVLLTLFFRNTSLMVALLLDANTQECVLDAINTIYNAIGNTIFILAYV